MSNHRRDSDRWITPRVVAWALFLATVLILAVIGAVTFLTVRGLDPDPMISLVAKVATGVGSMGTLLLQLTGRRTITKVERNFNDLGTKVDTAAAAAAETVAKVDHALWVDIHGTQQLPPVPPPVASRTQPHPFADTRIGGGPDA